mgnify:CR=1 FL=1
MYLAKDTALNRDVAIKVLDQAAAADGNLRRMFVKEARSLAQLSHPNVVSVFDVGEVQDQPYIVMEHVPGGSLRDRIDRTGPLKTGDAARFAVEIANGLAFAHSKGIIHADLKPSNILFDADDHAKIADFGEYAIDGEPITLDGLSAERLAGTVIATAECQSVRDAARALGDGVSAEDGVEASRSLIERANRSAS